jgi:hypothetical protein
VLFSRPNFIKGFKIRSHAATGIEMMWITTAMADKVNTETAADIQNVENHRGGIELIYS